MARENFQPSPGDVGSFEGHVGIVVGDGKTESANYYNIGVKNWGFTKDQEGIIFRRYIGK